MDFGVVIVEMGVRRVCTSRALTVASLWCRQVSGHGASHLAVFHLPFFVLQPPLLYVGTLIQALCMLVLVLHLERMFVPEQMSGAGLGQVCSGHVGRPHWGEGQMAGAKQVRAPGVEGVMRRVRGRFP